MAYIWSDFVYILVLVERRLHKLKSLYNKKICTDVWI